MERLIYFIPKSSFFKRIKRYAPRMGMPLCCLGVASPVTGGDEPQGFYRERASVDTSTMILVVRSSNNEKTFDVSSAQYAGGTSLQTLRKGNRVSVEYIGKYGKYPAVNVSKIRLKSTKGKTR